MTPLGTDDGVPSKSLTVVEFVSGAVPGRAALKQGRCGQAEISSPGGTSLQAQESGCSPAPTAGRRLGAPQPEYWG